MKNLAKRQWGPQLNVKAVADILIEWCIRAREKNTLRKHPPTIFYAFIVNDVPPLDYFHSISSVFRYSQKDMPYTDKTRETLLRCLSVGLKAHFFLFQEDVVSFEPYFFAIPSLKKHDDTIMGVVYTLEKEKKSIIICENDLSLLFKKEDIIYEFPVVVIEDSFKWFSLKNWFKIKSAANISENEKPWLNRKLVVAAAEAETKEELEKLATPLDVPYEIKDLIKPLGIEWSKKLKTWYLPKGFDVDSVVEYMDYVKKEYLQEKSK